MRASFADPVTVAELPVGRLRRDTLCRLMTAHTVHHRSGPWVACTEEFSRLIQVGYGLHRPVRDTSAPATGRQLERGRREDAEVTAIVAFDRVAASSYA